MGVMGWVDVRAKHKLLNFGKFKVKIWKPIGWWEWARQTLPGGLEKYVVPTGPRGRIC